MIKTVLLREAEQLLLTPTDLTPSTVSAIVGSMMGQQVDFADLYFQHSQSESWGLEDGAVKQADFDLTTGVGARVISGEKTGFAYSDDLSLTAIQHAAQAARSIAYQQGVGQLQTITPVANITRYNTNNPLTSLAEVDKVALLHRVDELARKLDPRVIKVNVNIHASHDTILVLASDGQIAADARPLIHFSVSVLVEHKGRREKGYAGGGGRYDYQAFLATHLVQHLTEEAVRTAVVNLEAQAAPAGIMPVVMGPGWAGVLLHEAVGHGLEGDFNRKGTSAFSNKIGQQVANPLVTVVDDGTLADRRGSLTIDDEGTQTSSTLLIENGILRGYMQDKLNARLMKVQPTGNGRRESYAHLPMPRMTNTYMLAGAHTPEEIIASIDKGLYVVGLGGGSVDITSGKFVFATHEAYYVEHGKILYPVKDATLVGTGFDVMQNISMVGNNLELDKGIGVCGKEGQSVPVGVGQPTIRIDAMTVGGTQKK
jgi:TldD protein